MSAVRSSGEFPPLRITFVPTFATDKVELRRRDGPIETHLEITVSPENHAEVRRLTFTNHGPRSHYLEVTSYAEIVEQYQQ